MLTQLIKLARPQQWLKNGVLLASLVFAGEITDTGKTESALLAMVLFCLLSSAVYTINDICDHKSDREHPRKKERPIASGRVSPVTAAVMAALLMAIGLIGAWYINPGFFWIALAFAAFNIIYSLILKHVVIVDVMSVAISFVLRAWAGAIAIDVPASRWLIANTLLLALFLAFGKRRHELTLLEDGAVAHRRSLSRYSKYLLDQMIGVTTASVVVIYILYTLSPEVSEKLETPHLYMTIPFVIYGIFRYLYLIHREDKGGSPTRVLITDIPILLTVVLWILASITILYWL
jgi:4-hydroxybenzoate polyprenyltransferase